MPKQNFQLMPESSQGCEQNDKDGHAATHFPKKVFGLGRIDNAVEIHAVVGGEERQREKDHGYGGKDQDSFVLAIRNYR